MLRLRLQLREGVYWTRWELLGTYTAWRKGSTVRINSVMAASQRAWPHTKKVPNEPHLNIEKRKDVYWFRWELGEARSAWVEGSTYRAGTILGANQAAIDQPLGD